MTKDKKVSRLNEKLELKEFKLNSLLEITTAINSNASVDKLLQIYEFILREQLGITKLILYNKDEEWKTLLKYGFKGKLKDISVDTDLIHIKEITVIESSSKNSLNGFDIVIPVFHKDQPLAYLLIGDLEEDAIKMSPTIKHMPFIQTLTNIIVVAIENKRFANKLIHQERNKKELEVAGEMQALLFPSDLPSNNRVDIAAYYRSHQLVGGDYYDFIELNNEEFVFCMADVSGKGVSAALLMSNFQANVRAIIKFNDFPLERLIKELNTKVFNAAKGEKFITFFIGRYNMTTRVLEYINAGHNHPILTDGDYAEVLDKGCTGLGMFEELPSIEKGTVTITENATVVLYTDGLVEIENDEWEPFETDNLTRIIHGNYDLPMNELNAKVFEALDEYRGEQPFLDDTAILSCRIY